jgi:hypothetical protein
LAETGIGAQLRAVMGSEISFSNNRTARLRLGIALLSLLALAQPARADLAGALAALQAVGPEGAGNAAATRAWAEVAAAPAAELPRIVAAMDGLGERARNYLFAAASSVADRELKAGRPLPVTALGDLLLDPERGARGRRLAFELIARADAAAAEALLPGLVDDPAAELRREAVQQLIDRAAKTRTDGRKESATVLYQQALGFARDGDQIESVTKALEDLGHPADLVRLLGFVTRWKVIGPFDNTGRAGFEKVFPPENELRFDAEYDGKDGKVRWKDFETAHRAGMVDFNQAYAPLKEVTGYAFAEFHSENARPAELRLGCKNGWKVWFNGRYLFGRDEYHRGAELDQYRLPVELEAGRNTILVKLTQDEEKEEWTVEWEYQLRVTDPTGRVIRSAPPAARVATR